MPSWKKDFAIAGILLGVGTLLFWITDWDFAIQNMYYHASTAGQAAGFEEDNNPFWYWLYHYGIFVGFAAAVVSLVLISMSYWSNRWLQARKAAVLMVLVVMVGPGLLANLIFKDHYGRPRPREVTTYGGTEPFSYVWQTGREGKSFPCGHCTMGFYLAVPFLFWRRNKPLWAYVALFFGIGFGLLLGISRIRVGAHWPSDVLWGAGFVWLVAISIYHALKVYQPIIPSNESDEAKRKKAKRMTWVVGIALPIISIGLFLATPYISHKELYVPASTLTQNGSNTLKLELGKATTYLYPANDSFKVLYKVNAFGFPNSKIHYEWVPAKTKADTSVYTIVPAGMFTEIKNNVTAYLPVGEKMSYLVKVSQGKIIVPAALLHQKGSLNLWIEKGDVVINTDSSSEFDIEVIHGEVENNTKNVTQNKNHFRLGTDTSAKIKIEALAGKIEIR